MVPPFEESPTCPSKFDMPIQDVIRGGGKQPKLHPKNGAQAIPKMDEPRIRKAGSILIIADEQ